MKKALLAAVALAAVAMAEIGTARAQEDENQMSIRVAGYEVLLKGSDEQPKKKGHNWRTLPSKYGGRIGQLEVGGAFLRSYADSYAAYPDSEDGFMMLDPLQSGSITFNFATFSSSLVRGNWLGVTLAAGVTYNQYGMDNPTPMAKIDRVLHPVASDETFKKSRLRTWWLHVPLVLEINPTRNFFISAGGYLDMMLGGDAMWKKPKHKLSNPYINPFQVGVTARVGFRDIYFFGNYALTDFFQKDKGPRFNSCSFGLGFDF